jgi:pyruvate/2-oxoglutarate dehydrogenase complex dihydrolipoamide dehydrogenase (E3) component
MPQATNYDVIVIGTSQGGRLLPVTFAKTGKKVAVIERGPLGGVCVNFGCTPTKTMVASARVAYLARRGFEYGIHTRPHFSRSAGIAQRNNGLEYGSPSPRL